jgi:putative ABC transport system permease protein
LIRLFFIAARNLGRSPLRSILTVLGAACALLTFVLLRTVLASWTVGQDYAAKDRLGTRHKVTFVMQLPKRYIDDIRSVPGVKTATWACWFGAKDPKRPNEFFANLAVDPPSFLEVMDDMVVSPEEKKAWLADKQGALVGDVLAKKLGLKVGDKITLEGSIYPGDWEFNISGIYTAGRKSVDRSQFLFHWDYMNDALPDRRKDQIGWVMTRVDDASKSGAISAAIDAKFDERDTQTVTMSEKAMYASFMGMFGALLTVLDVVSIAILVVMMLILGNTIAMGVRERTREYAVLRAIGFEPGHVRFFVIGEAAVLGLVAGVTGAAIAYVFVNFFVGAVVEDNMGAYFPYFRVQPETLGLTVLIAMVLAIVASVIPSIQAGRIAVTDALRRVG